jgi:hypothetical protein
MEILVGFVLIVSIVSAFTWIFTGEGLEIAFACVIILTLVWKISLKKCETDGKVLVSVHETGYKFCIDEELLLQEWEFEMKYFTTKIQKWKDRKDHEYAATIYRMLGKFWSSNRRKDFIVEMLLTVDFTNEDLIELGNLLGHTAHMRSRKET